MTHHKGTRELGPASPAASPPDPAPRDGPAAVSDPGPGNTAGKPRPGQAHAPRLQQDASAPRLRVSSPLGLLAAIPVVLGFHPAEPSIVVLGVTPPRGQVAVAERYDAGDPRLIARHATGILGAQGITTACAAGYGPASLVTPAAAALRARLTAAGITTAEFLRAEGGRYWSYTCADPGCCPPGGTPFDLDKHPVTLQYKNLALASREALAATIAPVTGETAELTRRAFRAADAPGMEPG